MALQSFNLGSFDNRNWVGTVAINSELLANPANPEVLRRFRFNTGAASSLWCNLITGGADLSSTWESSSKAITLVDANGLRVTIGGPTSGGTSTSDASEPYTWFPSGGQRSNLINWFNNKASGNVTLILDDGAAQPIRVQFGTEHNVQANGNLVVIPPADIRVQFGTDHDIRASGNVVVEPPNENTVIVQFGTDHAIRASGNVVVTPPTETAIRVQFGTNHNVRANGSVEVIPPTPVRVRFGTNHSIRANGNIFVSAPVPIRVRFGTDHTIQASGGIVVTPPDEVSKRVQVGSDHNIKASGNISVSPSEQVKISSTIDINVDVEFDGLSTEIAADYQVVKAHWLLEFIGRNYNIWSGDGDIEYNGKTYHGSGSLIRLSAAEIVINEPNRRLTATIAANLNSVISQLVTDTNIYDVEILWVVSLDQGLTYQFTGRRFRGRTNNPIYRNGLYVVEIEPYICENRGRPRKWSDESHRREYPADLGFSFANQLIDGVKRARWPS